MQTRNAEVLETTADSVPWELATALAGSLRREGEAELHVVGPGAGDHASRVVEITRRYLMFDDLSLVRTFTCSDKQSAMVKLEVASLASLNEMREPLGAEVL